MDEFGPLNLQPHPGRERAPIANGPGDRGRPGRLRRRATHHRPNGIRHLLAGYDLSTDRLYGHIKVRKDRTHLLTFCRYLCSLHPPQVWIAIVLDNFSPHRSTKTDRRVGNWASANNVELAYVPFTAPALNRRPSPSHCATSPSTAPTTSPTERRPALIRRYIASRNRHLTDPALRKVVRRAETIKRAKLA